MCQTLRRFSSSLLLVIVAILTQPRPAAAMRIVDFGIYLNGELILELMLSDRGEAPDVVWQYLKTHEFAPPRRGPAGARDAGGTFTISPDPADPLRATLTGDIEIFSRYGGSVDLTSLILTRTTADAKAWRIPPEEVDRTFKLRKVDFSARPRASKGK